MPPTTDGPELVILSYDPAKGIRHRQLQNSIALSHAARISYRRRQSAPRTHECPNHHENEAVSERKPREQERPSASKRTGNLPQVLNPGNSDPFNSIPVRVTPKVSMLLSIWNTHTETNPFLATRWFSARNVRQDLALDDELHVKSLLLASSALLYSRFLECKNLNVQRLECKHECIQQLKFALRPQSGTNQVKLAKGLSLMLVASLLSDEVSEAKLHSKQLFKAIMSSKSAQSGTQEKHVALLGRCFHYDNQCALAYMRPPLLDPTETIHEWKVYFGPAQRWMQTQLLVLGAVRHPAFSGGLEDLFRQLQDQIDLQLKGIPNFPSSIEAHARCFPAMYIIQLTGKFFRHLEFASRRSLDETDDLASSKWYTEIVLTLAGLAFLACAAYTPPIFSLKKRADKLLQALRGAVERCPYPVDRPPDFQLYQYSHLWALYIGATWEWDTGVYESGRGWYTESLREKVQELNVESWRGLQEIVQSFLRYPLKLGDGFLWVPGMDLPTSASGSTSRQRQSSSEFLEEMLFSR